MKMLILFLCKRLHGNQKQYVFYYFNNRALLKKATWFLFVYKRYDIYIYIQVCSLLYYILVAKGLKLTGRLLFRLYKRLPIYIVSVAWLIYE